MIMDKSDVALFTVLGVLFGAFLIFAISYTSEYKKVVTGELELFCDIKDKGFTKIEPHKIVDKIDDTWIFENGWAKACYTSPKGE
jgi:hypothetical protein